MKGEFDARYDVSKLLQTVYRTGHVHRLGGASIKPVLHLSFQVPVVRLPV
jgi:hypothetical protein